MDHKRLLKTLKRNNALFLLSFLLFLILVAVPPIAWYIKALIAVLVGGALFLVFSTRQMALAQAPLFRDLNPLQYHYVMHQAGYALRDGRVDIITALTMGDHAVVLDLCQRGLQREKKEALRLYYVLCIATTYLALGDMERLRQAIFDYRVVLKGAKQSKQQQQTMENAICACEAYLAGDFARYAQLARERLARPEAKKYAYFALDANFDLAVGLYLGGDTEAAKPLFSEVAQRCQMLAIGRLAAEYLRRMEQGGEIAPVIPPAQRPEGIEYPVQVQGGKKPAGCVTWLVLALAVTLLVASVSAMANDARGGETPLEEIEQEGYGLDVVDLPHSIPIGEEGDLLCLYLSDESIGNEEPEYVSYVTYLRKTEKGRYKLACEVDLYPEEPQLEYYLYVAHADLEICVQVFDDNAPLPAGKEAYRFTQGDKSYYLCVMYVESIPVDFDGTEVIDPTFDEFERYE